MLRKTEPMALKTLLDNLDGIDEGLHEHYTEVDGKFILDLSDDVKAHPKIKAMSNAMDRLKTDKNELKTKLDAAEEKIENIPEDFDLTEYEALKAGGGKDQPDLDAIRAAAEKQAEAKSQRTIDKLTKELGDVTGDRDTLKGSLNDRVIDGELTSVLVEAGVEAESLDIAKAALRYKHKFLVENSDNREIPMVEGEYGPVAIKDFVKEWAEGPASKPFIAGPRGGDAGGNGGRSGNVTTNPWAEKTRNLTAQGEILKKSPDQAVRMMKEASIPQSKIDASLEAAKRASA